MQLFEKIKPLSKAKSITIKELSSKVGMTESGFYKSIKSNTLKVDTLLKVAEVLEVDVREFFGGLKSTDIEIVKEFIEISKEPDFFDRFFNSYFYASMEVIIKKDTEFINTINSIITKNKKKKISAKLNLKGQFVVELFCFINSLDTDEKMQLKELLTGIRRNFFNEMMTSSIVNLLKKENVVSELEIATCINEFIFQIEFPNFK